MIISTVKRFFTPAPIERAAHELYVQIVAQARQPVFYRDWRAPDTLDGRFDVIVLHLYLVIARLEMAGQTAFIRKLSEAFFADMDRNLREMGASDTGVGIRVKNMAQAFYGRLKAYGDAISDTKALSAALSHNLWRDQPIDAPAVALLAAYMQRNQKYLHTQDATALMQGTVVFSS